MKTKITLLSLVLLSGSLSFGQTNKNLPTERLAKNGISNPVKFTPSYSTKAEGDVIWEDDFSVPGNWVMANTSSPTHGWTITTNTTAPFTGLSPIATPTVGNGFAMVDSDAAGDGSTTNANITLHASQAIDLTDHANVTLQFHNVTRNYASEYRVYVSGDNGTNWTEYVVNSHIGTNVNTTNPELEKVNITAAAAGQSQVLIRFNFIATWGWFWAVDDVEIVESPANDISITERFVSFGEIGFQYTKIPVSQAIANTRIGFGANVKNFGSLDQTLTLNVTSNAGTPLQSTELFLPTLATDTLSILAANGYSMPTTVGVYDFTLEVLNSTDNLTNTEDDSAIHPFEITNLIMAADSYDGTNASITGGFTGWAGNQSDPGIGTEFEIFADASLERVQVGIFPIADQADYVGNELFCQIWKFNEETGWALASISQFKTIVAGDFGKMVNLQFEEPLSLVAGDVVLPIASFFTGSAVPIMMAGNSISGTTTGIGNGELIGLAGDGNYVEVPVVRLDFGTYLNIEESAIQSMNVTLYPNPASNNATIAYTLNTESTVTIEVRDLSGKLVYSSNEGNQKTGAHTTSIATDKFAEGMYTYTLTANGSQVTNKFIVKK